MEEYEGVDILRPSTWLHLIIPFEELTEQQKDQAYMHHVATGGDLLFLKNGEVIHG
jgi:hypothetical protein